MASVGELLGPARLLCAERVRRLSYASSSQVPLVVLMVVGTVRLLANAYLAALVGPHLPPLAGTRYLAGSSWLLACFFCSAGAARAFHATSPLLTHQRFRTAPVSRWTLRLTAAWIALFRPMTAAVTALLGVAVGVTVAVWGMEAVRVGEIVAILGAGLLAFLGSYAALELWGPGRRTVGYLETLAVFALVYGNPDLRVEGGGLVVTLLNGSTGVPAPVGVACLWLGAFPAALAAGGLIARLARRLRGRRERAHPRGSIDPFDRLYRADLPLGLFAGSFVVEGALVLASAMPLPALRALSAALFALRVGWFALFLLRTDYRIAEWRPAPVLSPRRRLLVYAHRAPLHAALSVAPLLFHIARGLRG